MTNTFTPSKGLGSITSRTSAAFRQGITSWAELIRHGSAQILGKLKAFLAGLIYLSMWLILAHDVIGCVGLGLGLFPQLQGVSVSKTAIENFYLMTKGLDEEEILIRRGILT
jgi:hypothetical protein